MKINIIIYLKNKNKLDKLVFVLYSYIKFLIKLKWKFFSYFSLDLWRCISIYGKINFFFF